MVLAWDNWSTLSANVHKYIASQARCPTGLLVVNGAGLGQLVHIVCQCTYVYGISGKTSHFVPCHPPCRGCWWSMVLDNWSILRPSQDRCLSTFLHHGPTKRTGIMTTKANTPGTLHLQLPCALLLLFIFLMAMDSSCLYQMVQIQFMAKLGMLARVVSDHLHCAHGQLPLSLSSIYHWMHKF